MTADEGKLTARVVGVRNVAPLSAHDAAVLDAGRALIVGAIDAGRDLCKTMITVASGAIPVHVGLIGLTARPDLHPGALTPPLALVGPTLYLASVGAFAYGYFPALSEVSLDDLTRMRAVYEATIARRYKWAKIGFGLFAGGIVGSVGAAAYFFFS